MQKLNQLKKSDQAQTSILFIFVGGILIFGIFYILFGSMMGSLVTNTNNLIASQSIPFSEQHKNGMDNMFRIWWLVPVIVLLIFILYLIKKRLEKRPDELYGG